MLGRGKNDLTESSGEIQLRRKNQIFLHSGGVMVDLKLTMTHQSALVTKVASNIQGCTGRTDASR